MTNLNANGLAGNKNAGTREKDDFYPTPPHATLALLQKEAFEGSVWECACGDGAISEVLKAQGFSVYSTDKFDRGYGDGLLDFVTDDSPLVYENIITNPPYKLSQEFVEAALARTTGKVAFLMKLNFLESARRYELFQNTPLKTVYVFSKRLNFYQGDLKGTKSGVMAFAWFVWEHGYEGRPQIDWIL